VFPVDLESGGIHCSHIEPLSPKVIGQIAWFGNIDWALAKHDP